jgi:hypothetical protein
LWIWHRGGAIARRRGFGVERFKNRKDAPRDGT